MELKDEEIKEALEEHIAMRTLADRKPKVKTDLLIAILDFINRQQVEIEQAKSEAIKEFAERFIDEECAYCSSGSDEMIFFKKRFDNLLAEMVGGENA